MRTLITLSFVALAAAAQGQLVSSSGSVSPSRAEPGDLDVARGKKETMIELLLKSGIHPVGRALFNCTEWAMGRPCN